MPQDTEITLQTEIMLLKERLDNLDRFYSEKFIAAEQALLIAQTASNKRLDGMNEFRDALRDQTSTMISRVEAVAAMTSSDERNIAEITALRDKVADQGRPNYVLFGSLASGLAVLIGGVWIVIGLKIDNAAIPIVLSTAEIRTNMSSNADRITAIIQSQNAAAVAQSASTAADLASRTDRASINDKLVALREDLAVEQKDRRTEINKLTTRVTRLSIWLDFLHAKVFPGQAIPPIQTEN